MSVLTPPEVGTQELCFKGVHNVFLQIHFGCHGFQRLKPGRALWSHFMFFLQLFFFLYIYFIFCFVLSLSQLFGRILHGLLAFCFLLFAVKLQKSAPWVYNGRITFFFLAISQNHKALFCHKSPPRTHRDWLRRLWGRTYRNTSLMLRIVRRVLVLQRVFKTCVQAAGDLQWQEAYELMSTYRRHYGWVVLTSSS